MFVTFEGYDGVGKSTAVRLVAERLRSFGFPVTTTRTPGGTPIGKELRELLVGNKYDIPKRARPFMFLADMVMVTKEVIAPAHLRGDIVLCDRFFDSTMVYQVLCERCWSDVERESLIDLGVLLLPFPDLTVVIDAPFETSKGRLESRGDKLTHYDLAERHVIAQRRAEFFDLPSRFPHRNIHVVSSSKKSPDQLAGEITDLVLQTSGEIDGRTAIAAS